MARRDLLLLIAFVILLRLPFLNQAVQGDDVYYLAGAEHALIDPAHPTHVHYALQGEMADMRGHPHPPLNSWFLAALLAIFGSVLEIPFHLAYILFSLLCAVAMWSMARRFSPHPLWASLLFLVTPAFVVNGSSFEADIPFLAFWMAGFALFFCAVDTRSLWPLCAAALSLGLAVLAAPQAIVSAPILGLYAWHENRRWWPAWCVACFAPVVYGGWQLFERWTGGTLPAAVLAGYFSTYGLQQLSNKLKNAAALTTHLAWLVFPPLAASAFRSAWPFFCGAGVAGLFIDWNPLFWLSFGIGVQLLAWCIRDRSFLASWILMFFAAALFLFFAGSARYLLPIAAPVAILASRERRWLVPAFAAQLVLSASLAWVNFQHWDSYRQFARKVPQGTSQKRVFVNGEWGLRYYLEEKGALPVLRSTQFRSGDTIISHELGYPLSLSTGGLRLAKIDRRSVTTTLPLRLIGLHSKSGYSTASLGFRPFDITYQPIDWIDEFAAIAHEPTKSYLLMDSPEASEQIAGGLYAPEGKFRWMGENATILLHPPPRPSLVEVKLYVPDQAPARLVTLTLDGVVVHHETLPGPGSYVVSADSVSGRTLTITVDKTFTVPGDSRRLGAVITEAGFR